MERLASLRDTGRDMPDAAKQSRQGTSGHFAREAVRQGLCDFVHSHDSLYAEAGCPPQYTLEGVPRYRWELRDKWGGPTQLLADALARGVQPVDNPAYRATVAGIRPSTAGAILAESYPCGRDSVGLATIVTVGNRRVIAALGSASNLVPKGHPAHMPLASKPRNIRNTGGYVEEALPYGYRWATAADQPGHDNTGYTVKLTEDTPEPPARKRERGKRSPEAAERRKARAAAKRRAKYDN